jgi:type IV secretion system protein VirB1
MSVIAAALAACASFVNPDTLDRIVRVESGGFEWALNVNHLARQPHATSAQEAAEIANHYISLGYRVDIGIAQVSSQHLARLGMTVEQLLVPCTNIYVGGEILASFYGQALARTGGQEQAALRMAISNYHCGSCSYDADYLAAVVNIPNLPISPMIAHAVQRRRPDPYTADTVVFERAGLHVEIN